MGSNNIAIGHKAGPNQSGGASVVTGNRNILIGHHVSASSSSAENQIVIGADALGIENNSVVLGNDNINKTLLKGNVGIGITDPQEKLDVDGSIMIRTAHPESGEEGIFFRDGLEVIQIKNIIVVF